MTSNTALWLTAKRGELKLQPAPYTSPLEHQILVKNRAIAINPVDTMMQSMGDFVFPWLKYPAIFGSDVAGEVVEVGPEVTRFKVGDRVLGHAVGSDKSRNRSAEGAFQELTILLDHMTTPIPDELAYENAAVLPLGLSTAACGLFQTDFLALQHPSASLKPTGQTLLVWGGSTSVGSNAIQLAVAAGYDVITTASPKNADYCRKLGASAVFDYRNPAVVNDIVAIFKGRTCAGALAIGVGSTAPCLEIVHRVNGSKFVAVASPSISLSNAPKGASRALWLVPKLGRLLASGLVTATKSRIAGVRTKFIFGSSLVSNEVGGLIYRDFLPGALAEGRYLAAPDPLVVGHELAALELAMKTQSEGVSARKVVVTL